MVHSKITKVVPILFLILVLLLAALPASASQDNKASLSAYNAWIVPGGADITWSISNEAGVTAYQIYRHLNASSPGLHITTIWATGAQSQAYYYHDTTPRPRYYSIRVLRQGGPTRYGPFRASAPPGA